MNLKRDSNGLIMRHKDKHPNKNTDPPVTEHDSKESENTKYTEDLFSILSLETLLRIFCGLDK